MGIFHRTTCGKRPDRNHCSGAVWKVSLSRVFVGGLPACISALGLCRCLDEEMILSHYIKVNHELITEGIMFQQHTIPGEMKIASLPVGSAAHSCYPKKTHFKLRIHAFSVAHAQFQFFYSTFLFLAFSVSLFTKHFICFMCAKDMKCVSLLKKCQDDGL